MARSDDGEFELILGNKQLLSVFFIIVVLLGVFFTMGYIVGKNSFSEDIASNKDQKALIVESTVPPKRDSGSIVIDPVRPTPEAKPSPSATPTPVPTTAKTEDPAPSKKKPEERKDTPVPTAKPPERPASTSKAVLSATGEPSPGQTFLQVVASTQPDSEIIADVLKRKGFAALVVPVPNSNLYRVLVGPLTDAATISKTRSDLEAAGFQKPYLRKY